MARSRFNRFNRFGLDRRPGRGVFARRSRALEGALFASRRRRTLRCGAGIARAAMFAAATSAMIALALSGEPARADNLRYQAVWHSGSGSNIVTGPLLRAAFMTKGEELTAKGLRLVDVETDQVNGRRVYVGVWIGGSGGNIFAGPLSAADFAKERRKRRDQGLRLVDFETFRRGGKQSFVGVWRPGSGRERITGPDSSQALIERGERLTAQGLRLVDLEAERGANGELRYRCLWREGSGGNLFTGPRGARSFRKLRDEMSSKGMELEDVERVQVNGRPRFVGVWRAGDGESRVSNPRKLDAFIKFGEGQTAAGKRTRDVELFAVAPPAESPAPGASPTAGTSDLPEPPRWIQLSGSTRLIVDFGRIIDGNPHVTLPVDFLPDFLPESDGELVIPDNFCGFNIRKADSFFWHTQANQVVTEFPYNSVEDVFRLGDQAFLGGISFTGPMGRCLAASNPKPWQFFQPFTQTGGDSPIPGLKLIVEMRQGSEIEFLNFNIHAGSGLPAHKLFSDDVFKHMKAIAKTFESLKVDNGYCGIDNYVQKICKDEKEGEAPIGSCPVGDDFESGCE